MGRDVTDPTLSSKRVRWERAIWLIDLACYLFAGVAGGFALWATPESIREAVRVDWVITSWGLLLFIGGAVSFLGRLIRVWAVEMFANVFASWGAFLFALILVPAALASTGWAGVLAFVFIAWLSMLRRYAELKIFTNEPGLTTVGKRLEAALKRRTGNTVPRGSYH